MADGWLQLKFLDKGAGLVCGAAWVVSGSHEITPDCATYSELDKRLGEMERDIAAIRKKAFEEFERCQGPGGRNA